MRAASALALRHGRNGLVPVLPRHAAGMRIGLLGGTFNPAHAAHRLVSLIALRRLNLDRVWWLVTPGNPLKDNDRLPPLADRLAAAAKVARHPRIDVTGLEAAIGAQFTYDTIVHLQRRLPNVRFVWLMGADSLVGFHRWHRWRALAARAPFAVIDRPMSTLAATHSKAGQALARFRVDETDGRVLADLAPPAWVFIHGPRSSLSSTALRNEARRQSVGRR